MTFPALDDIMKLTHANDATGGRLQIGIPGRRRIGMHGRLRRNPQLALGVFAGTLAAAAAPPIYYGPIYGPPYYYGRPYRVVRYYPPVDPYWYTW